jgi:hypothetical protein
LVSVKILKMSNLVMKTRKNLKSTLVEMCQKRWDYIAMMITFVISGGIMMLAFLMV